MTLPYFTLGDAAIGRIEPTISQQERLEEFTSRLASGEFHKQLPDGAEVPVRCVDGRNLLKGDYPLAPNAAGASESLFVADDLTVRHFLAQDKTVLSGYSNTLAAILEAGYEVGGHNDIFGSGDTSGCGANDRLPEIYSYIAQNAEMLREVAAKLGVVVSDATHRLIQGNAALRTQFSKGTELFDLLGKKANQDFIGTSDGAHNEVAVVINTRPLTTLDRAAVKAEFGSAYQAFNADVWAFEKAASIGSKIPEETAQKFAGMVYYNLATTMVLGGPNLRVVVLA